MGKGTSDDFATFLDDISNSPNPYPGPPSTRVMPLDDSLPNGHHWNKMDDLGCLIDPGVFQQTGIGNSVADQSLASAFARLSLCNGMKRVGSTVPELSYDQWGLLGTENPSVVNLELQEPRAHHSACCSPYRSVPLSLPSSQEMNLSYLPPNLAASGVEIPAIPSHHQYFLASQSPRLYGNYQELEQYLYLQELRNQLLVEAYHHPQANGTSTNRSMSWNPMPFSQQSGVSNHVAYRSQASEVSANHLVEKLGKYALPQKILTRSNGMNSLRSSMGFTNGQRLLTSNSGYFQTGSLSHRSSSGFVHDSLRTQLHRYECLEELAGRMHLIAKDQNGCRFLQSKFTEGTPEDVSKIFNGIIDHIVDLLTDPFGNYLIQKLLEVCTEDQRTLILRTSTRKPGDLIRISCDMHGTRVVQKLIEKVKTSEQSALIVSSLKPGVITLMKNVNGIHVAQRCLEHLKPEHKEFLLEAAISIFFELATDRYGCCMLQRCISCSDGKNRQLLVSNITANALILSEDQFGNYVVQFIFSLQISWATMDIIYQLENHFCDLSVQKHSSHVVEKCLKHAGEEGQFRIIQELTAQLERILHDPYGNYVIQAALNNSRGAVHAQLVNAIKPHVPMLRMSPFGKKVLSSNGLKK